jgi:hypothetical protein
VQTQSETIHGIVKSGSMPIPGAAPSISSGTCGISTEKITIGIDVDGSYSGSMPHGEQGSARKNDNTSQIRFRRTHMIRSPRNQFLLGFILCGAVAQLRRVALKRIDRSMDHAGLSAKPRTGREQADPRLQC